MDALRRSGGRSGGPPSVGSEAYVVVGDRDMYTTYKRRWYVLAVFTLLSVQQSFIWITFSPVAANAEKYYGVGTKTISLLLNYGPIMFIPSSVLTLWLMSKGPRGLRQAILLGATLGIVAGFLQGMPSLFKFKVEMDIYFQHGAAIANAWVGPIVMSTVSMLSSVWFPPHERATATSIACVANTVGSALGFLVGPAVVTSPEKIPTLLYIHLIHSILIGILVWAYFPAEPPTPPSATAVTSGAHDLLWEDDLADSEHSLDYSDQVLTGSAAKRSGLASAAGAPTVSCSIMLHAAKRPEFILICLVGGLQSGVGNGWNAMLDVILEPAGIGQTQAGWMGFGTILAAIVGGVLAGIALDKAFRRQYKVVGATLLLLTGLSYGLFTISLPSFLKSTPIVKASPALLLVTLLVAGFLIGGAYPLFFELAAEITYPLDASVSGVAMMVVNNVACLLLLAIFGFVPTVVFNPTMTFTVFLCLGLLLFIPARYRRSDADDRAADGAEAGERINGGRAVNAGGNPGGVRDTDRLLAR